MRTKSQLFSDSRVEICPGRRLRSMGLRSLLPWLSDKDAQMEQGQKDRVPSQIPLSRDI